MPNLEVKDSICESSFHTKHSNSPSQISLRRAPTTSSWQGRSVKSSNVLQVQSIAKPKTIISIQLSDVVMTNSKKKGLLRRFANKCVSLLKIGKKKETLSQGPVYERSGSTGYVEGKYDAEKFESFSKNFEDDESEIHSNRFFASSCESNYAYDSCSPEYSRRKSEQSDFTQNGTIDDKIISGLSDEEIESFEKLSIFKQRNKILSSLKELETICTIEQRNVDYSAIRTLVWEIYEIIEKSASDKRNMPRTDVMVYVYSELKNRITFVKHRPVAIRPSEHGHLPIKASEERTILEPIQLKIILESGKEYKRHSE